MRFIFSALLVQVLMVAKAAACPILAGGYICTGDHQQRSIVTVRQANIEGGMKYEIGKRIFNADNIAYPTEDSDTLKEATERSWCDGQNGIISETQGQVFKENKVLGKLQLTTTLSLDGSRLKQTDVYSVTGDKGEIIDRGQSELNCSRY